MKRAACCLRALMQCVRLVEHVFVPSTHQRMKSCTDTGLKLFVVFLNSSTGCMRQQMQWLTVPLVGCEVH
jgi:hypothetical protein